MGLLCELQSRCATLQRTTHLQTCAGQLESRVEQHGEATAHSEVKRDQEMHFIQMMLTTDYIY